MSPARPGGRAHWTGWAPQETEAWRTTPEQRLKGAAGRAAAGCLCIMTSWLLPLLLPLLLSGPPAVWPAPPTCYSRMLSLSREITGDFQSLQATEPSVSSLRPAEDQQVQCRPSLPLHQANK